MPCKERYVTTDCLHTRLWWGKSPQTKSQTSFSRKHYRTNQYMMFMYNAIIVERIRFYYNNGSYNSGYENFLFSGRHMAPPHLH